jgi:branched-chain amino acid transport system substrate-binding protein
MKATYLLVACGFAFLSGCGKPSVLPTLYVGHLAPRTGPERERGLSAEKAILLAVEDARAADNQEGSRPIAVLHADSRADPEGTASGSGKTNPGPTPKKEGLNEAEVAQSVAVRLITINHVAALIGGRDPVTAERLVRIGQQFKLPVMTQSWLPASVMGAYGFTALPPPAERGKALAIWAAKELKLSRVAVVTDSRSPANVSFTAGFIEALGAASVVSQQEYAGDDKLSAIAEQLLAVKPAAILVSGTSSALEKLRMDLVGAGLKEAVPFFFGGDEDDKLVALTDEAAGSNAIYWTTFFVVDDKLPRAREFARKYQERFQQPPDAASALAYDSARLLFEAIRLGGRTTKGERLREELLRLKDFECLTGSLSFDKGQAAVRPIFVVQRRDKQLKIVSGL